ncbi:unnamed protein product [Lampetra fluviatilis]
MLRLQTAQRELRHLFFSFPISSTLQKAAKPRSFRGLDAARRSMPAELFHLCSGYAVHVKQLPARLGKDGERSDLGTPSVTCLECPSSTRGGARSEFST